MNIVFESQPSDYVKDWDWKETYSQVSKSSYAYTHKFYCLKGPKVVVVVLTLGTQVSMEIFEDCKNQVIID